MEAETIKKKKLILLELNEINFDAIRYYLNAGKKLPGFENLFTKGILNTSAEVEYKNLEPWIQWPSVHTGKTFDEHQIFRLGDVVHSQEHQIFEEVESMNYTVGAISPMNARNNLSDPAYFIPDPWTKTDTDKSFLSEALSKAINQSVNDNSNSKLTMLTVIRLIFSFISLVPVSKYADFIFYAMSCIRFKWKKSIFLDKFLFEIHESLLDKNKTDFSTLFLNAGAHIQHHYFFNSQYIKDDNLKNPSWYIDENQDPLFEVFLQYDHMIQRLQKKKDYQLIIATGLSQKPYHHTKYYYRLKNHNAFLDLVGIKFKNVYPRMTRDFLITFSSKRDLEDAKKILGDIVFDNNIKMFGEIDNRNNELFVVLTYPHEIFNNTLIKSKEKSIKLFDHVSFVAIKNGEHHSKGFAYFSEDLNDYLPNQNAHVKNIYSTIKNYFSENNDC